MTAVQHEPVRVLFLGGLGRSGSTLLERMLAEMPGVAALGEVVHLWERALGDDERCGCGRPFSACPFWVEVGRRAFGGWDRLDAADVLALKDRVDRTRFVGRLALPVLRPAVRHDLRRYLDLYERLVAAAAQVSGAAVVVDSSKHVSLAYCLRWSRRIDLSVLHVVRDSPAVAYAWTKEVRRPEADGAGTARLGAMMPRYGALRVAARWVFDNAAFDLLRLLGSRVALVRYEDLVRRPGPALARAAAHAGIRAAVPDGLEEGHLVLQVAHTVAGNPMRFHTGPLEIRGDDVWRTRYPAAQRRAVSALTSPLRLRFGYSSGSTPPQLAPTGAGT